MSLAELLILQVGSCSANLHGFYLLWYMSGCLAALGMCVSRSKSLLNFIICLGIVHCATLRSRAHRARLAGPFPLATLILLRPVASWRQGHVRRLRFFANVLRLEIGLVYVAILLKRPCSVVYKGSKAPSLDLHVLDKVVVPPAPSPWAQTIRPSPI